MKRLTCEMCGSTDLTKQDGVFVCQTCGCKYSVEEAKKMMVEGTVEVQGTVRVDNSDKIKNYLEMAKSAYEAGNRGESEAYCNRIIEIESQNSEAWYMKGKAAGWQSTLANIRIEESVQCFSKAIDYAAEEYKETIQKNAADEMSELSLALIALTCSNFAQCPTSDNRVSIIENFTKTLGYANSLFVKCKVKSFDFKNQAAIKIGIAGGDGYVKCFKEYLSERHPSDYQFKDYLSQALQCKTLIEFAVKFAEDNYEENANLYELLIKINDDLMKYGGWTSTYYSSDTAWLAISNRKKGIKNEIVGNTLYSMTIKLNDKTMADYRDENDEYRKKIDVCKHYATKQREEKIAKQKAEQQAKNDAYWAEHAEEKQQLEAELNSLNTQFQELHAQIDPYDREISNFKSKREEEVPAEKEKSTVLEEISRLRKEKKSLGIFKGKEKKALQAQIDELNSRLPSFNESIEVQRKEQTKACNDKIKEIEKNVKPIKDKIVTIEKRMGEIKIELTKDR